MTAWTVKMRIVIAMSLLLTIMALTAAASWALLLRAEQQGRNAASSEERADAARHASERVGRFIAASSELAYAVTQADEPELASVTYGEVLGAQADAERALSRLGDRSGQRGLGDRAIEQWERLRSSTFLAVNAEAADSGAVFRWQEMPNGSFRAGAESNITTPDALLGLTQSELRSDVRQQGVVLRDATLRTMLVEAETDSANALAAANTAMSMTRNVIVALVFLSAGVAAAVATWLYRTIANPLQAAQAYADAVSHGELDAARPRATPDEIGGLTNAVADMKESVVRRVDMLKEIAGVVMLTAEAVEASATHALDAVQKQVVVDTPRASSTTEASTRVSDLREIVSQATLLKSLASEMLEH